MKILYHLATLPPKIPKAEAIAQEISVLCHHFDGDTIYINPNQHSPVYVPRLAFGLHKLKYLRRIEAGLQLHHFYNPDPFPFFYLRLLRRPVVYSISCGVSDKRPSVRFLSSLDAIAAADERSLKRLKAWGIDNVFLVKPGIKKDRYTFSPLPVGSKFRLMVGSAPWTKAQFVTKGIDALLDAAQMAPNLHLIFLWRGVLANEIDRRVQQANLEHRVTLIHKFVDVNKILADVHASIALAANPGILKSYPHSLLDSLAAGKPVIINQEIPMSDYVRDKQCGVVIDQISPTAIIAGVENLKRNYQQFQNIALTVGQQDFSINAMVSSFEKLYNFVIDNGSNKA